MADIRDSYVTYGMQLNSIEIIDSAKTKVNVMLGSPLYKENDTTLGNLDKKSFPFEVSTVGAGMNFREILKLMNSSGAKVSPSSLSLKGEITLAKSSTAVNGLRVQRIEVETQAVKTFMTKILEPQGDGTFRKSIGDYTYIYDVMPNFGPNDPYVIGKCDNVMDGDTIRIIVEQANKVSGATVGKALTVRLVGINCPETRKDEGDWYQRNEEWAAKHGLEPPTDENGIMDKLCAIADEGKRFIHMLALGRTIYIDPEQGQNMDAYGRLVGVAYVDNDPTKGDLTGTAICLNTSIIANKSQVDPEFALAEPSIYYGTNGLVESKFPITSWWGYAPDYKQKEADLKARQKADKEYNGKEAFLEKYGLVEVKDENGKTSIDNKTEIVYNKKMRVMSDWDSYKVVAGDDIYSISKNFSVSIQDIFEANNIPISASDLLAAPNTMRLAVSSYIYTGKEIIIPKYETITDTPEGLYELDKLNNANDVPADSQTDNLENMIVDDRNKLDMAYGIDPTNPYKLRIGDCTFLVPPLSIRVDTLSSNRRVQVLRSKSSMQTQTGNSSTTITVDLFFPNLQSVNGYEYKGPAGKKYYRNGLRPLVAQFKKAPFLPIENELINDRFKVQAVVLKDLEIMTVPGFPGCMQAKLTLAEFDHLAYMPHEEDFAATFCWPLYRWFYQKSMQVQDDPNRTHLREVSNLSNSIKFTLPDEGALNERRQAIYDLNQKIHPDIYQETNTRPGATMGNLVSDENEAKGAVAQYAAFQEIIARYSVNSYPLLYDKYGAFNPAVNILPCLTWNGKPDPSDPNAGVPDNFDEIMKTYNPVLKDIISSTYFSGVDWDSVLNTGYGKRIYFALNKLPAILELISLADRRPDPEHYYSRLSVTELQFARNPEPLVSFATLVNSEAIFSGVYDANNINGGVFSLRIKALYNKNRMKKSIGGDIYIVDPTDVIAINNILNTGEKTDLSFVDYRVQFEKLNFTAHMTEADIPTVDFPIDDIYIQQITATMHNSYAPLQLSSQESPTFQHIGASDIVMDMSIRTKSREAVEKFRMLMTEAQRYARDYRIAITSGIVGIETPIMSMLGVKSILIERLSVETSKEDKESFNINISLIAFDKTQRMKEDLDMVKAMGGTKDQIENAFYAYSKRRRNESGFEYAIVDFALRDLEVYPDLELPTYDELNADLPSLKITYPDGTLFKQYPNPDNAKFVDPDFYIRCEATFRDYILSILEDGGAQLYFKDAQGWESFDYGANPSQQKTGQMTNPNVAFSPEALEWLKSEKGTADFGEKDIGNKKDNGWGGTTSNTSIEKNLYDPKTTDDTRVGFVRKAISECDRMAPEVSDAVKAKITQESVSKYPTQEEIARWFNLPTYGYASGLSVQFRDPTEKEFVEYLDYLVGIYWPNIPSDKERIAAGEIDLPTYTYGKTRVSAPEITQEKISNVLKALYELEHGWKQFNPDGLIQWSPTNDIGIAQLNAYTSGILQTLDEARHAAWDWRFNLKKGVEFFAQQYNWCINYGPTYNPDAMDNPLDWAMVCYNKGPKSGLVNYSQPHEVDYYNAVMNIFKNKYGADATYTAATPNTLYEPDIAVSKGMVKQDYLDLMAQATEANKQTAAKQANYSRSNYKTQGYFVGYHSVSYSEKFGKHALILGIHPAISESNGLTGKGFWFDLDAPNYLLAVDPFGEEGQAEARVKKEVYNGDKENVYADAKWSHMWWAIAASITRRMWENKDFNPEKQFIRINRGAADIWATFLASKDGKSYRDLSRTGGGTRTLLEDCDVESMYDIINQEDIDAVKDDIIYMATERAYQYVSPDNPAKLYRSSFKDMMEYDHRGRLVRAFPTYQMFIIDEGRWMAWHKLWDNFYGYNSVMSIDVMKDRKIAADTAVITMTNIYHNLTSYDNEVSYGEWDYTLGDIVLGATGPNGSADKVWKALWGLPDRDVLRARSDELNSMMLKPGARIHLRLGYGANAYRLPVVFNGTLTEMNAGEVVTVIAQGDGIELCNKLKVAPGQVNTSGIFGDTKEPRQLICELLTSKGTGKNAWLANLVNDVSDGVFYNTHPLGIVHFGVSEMPIGNILGGIDIFNRFEDYGEAGQNIYCGAGINTKSQWIYTDGVKKGEDLAKQWNWTDVTGPGTIGNEPDIKIDLFNQTPWSILQLYAATCPDYMASVIPFEFRSTAFFGKPWWDVIDKYKYKYFYDEASKMFTREPYDTERKAFSQSRIYSSQFDILGNNIRATEELMYTNVVAQYDKGKKKTGVVQIDSDIYPEKQTTAVIDLPIFANGAFIKPWTSERYAWSAAASALRDYVKDMYQGELVVMGDPTAKPYDTMYIQDTHTDMSGICGIQRVVHQLSMETGFITSITPDCSCIIDDQEGISIITWVAGALAGLGAFTAGLAIKNKMWKALYGSTVAGAFRKWGKAATNKLLTETIAKLANATPGEVKVLQNISDEIVDYLRALMNPDIASKKFNADIIKNDLWTILKKNKTVASVSDDALKKVSSVFSKISDAVKTPGGVGKAVDNLWDSAEVLKTGRLFAKKSGFLKGLANVTYKTGNRLAKLALKVGGNTAAAGIRTASAALHGIIGSTGVGLLVEIAVDVAVTILVATAAERYTRFLRNFQAVVIIPLKYRGDEFVAGINGHKGCILGEEPSAWDKFVSGTGWGSGVVNVAYGLLGITPPSYKTTVENGTSKLMGDE